jgi:hypothetical protein
MTLDYIKSRVEEFGFKYQYTDSSGGPGAEKYVFLRGSLVVCIPVDCNPVTLTDVISGAIWSASLTNEKTPIDIGAQEAKEKSNSKADP